MEQDEISEEDLQEGEDGPADHHHDGVEETEEALWDHLAYDHAMAVPQGLSMGTLQGMHDRFHGEAHALDD